MSPQKSSKRAPSAFRGPSALRADDPKITIEQSAPSDPVVEVIGAEDDPPARIPDAQALKRGIRWGGILLSALGGLVVLFGGLWLDEMARSLMARQDWLGWLTLVLLATAGIAALMIAASEIWALIRLRRLGRLHNDAQSAINHDDATAAARTLAGIRRLYAARDELAWGRSRLAEHDGDIMSAREKLVLCERELVSPLDKQANAIIATTARRVSVLTAVSPSSITDMIVVAILNLRMLRRIAANYGARPGTVGLFRLARMVVSHIVLTGGIAIGDDLIQQVIGHRLTAKLSARLGEGVFNGALTGRIGLATIDVCRPLPYIEAKRPRLRDLLALLLK